MTFIKTVIRKVGKNNYVYLKQFLFSHIYVCTNPIDSTSKLTMRIELFVKK